MQSQNFSLPFLSFSLSFFFLYLFFLSFFSFFLSFCLSLCLSLFLSFFPYARFAEGGNLVCPSLKESCSLFLQISNLGTAGLLGACLPQHTNSLQNVLISLWDGMVCSVMLQCVGWPVFVQLSEGLWLRKLAVALLLLLLQAMKKKLLFFLDWISFPFHFVAAHPVCFSHLFFFLLLFACPDSLCTHAEC